MPATTLTDRDRDLLFGNEDVAPGDAVVHFEHGLAAYQGEEVCDLGDTQQNLVTLMYRHGGKLSLPAKENVDFWQYGAAADAVTLDRLKAGDWVKRRDEMVAELKESADAILAVETERRAAKACVIDPPKADMTRFSKGFIYTETADQETAISAILTDLKRDVPMHRLLIGDVGFGKTEVAFRAAAAAVFSGYQVILAAPTTVLARQHFEDATARFGDAGIRIAELSRMTTDTEKDALAADLKGGRVQMLVTTQAILTADLPFADLALVIIDEEQKFGEDDKAALRGMARGAHVLAMTATPIPRSLAAAEVGLLDVSVIATAPKDRLPVETRVARAQDALMLAAITREIARDGQCYVVCPRVSQIDDVAKTLAESDGGYSVETAHAQMPDADMVRAMLRFMAGEVDVLVSTSIIESGLDNGRANTMVVHNAEYFGLSQLHQLRGRIGRSKLPARMLLLTDIDPDEDSPAADRLRAFAEMSELGSGFRIARKDRDIRGFGKLDTAEQSGQQSRLGIGLYRHILREHLS